LRRFRVLDKRTERAFLKTRPDPSLCSWKLPDGQLGTSQLRHSFGRGLFSSQDNEYLKVAFFERGGGLIHARNWPLSSATVAF
jgi:hypothetical protein